MTPQQISLVTTSWKQVMPISDTTAELFYGKLFEMNPALKPLFKGDMRAQGKKLMTMITTAVMSLDKLETIVPAVQDLGRRHAKYGVKDKDYDTVAGALLWTLGQGLGAGFTVEVKEAWVVTYTVLANTMKEASAT